MIQLNFLILARKTLDLKTNIKKQFRTITADIHSRKNTLLSLSNSVFCNLTLSAYASPPPPSPLIRPLCLCTQDFQLGNLITFVNTLYFNYHGN
jgi:hypothetical protein